MRCSISLGGLAALRGVGDCSSKTGMERYSTSLRDIDSGALIGLYEYDGPVYRIHLTELSADHQ